MERTAITKSILVFKGILLYTTIIAVMLYIGGIDSIYTSGHIILSTAIIITLLFICKRVKFSYNEITKLTGFKYLK
jgi:ABC-type uncharacterized transport system permease subunit